MYLTPAQIKGRIKNVAKQNESDPITLLRIYMMERFLERITYSKYKDDFIVKGGILVTSMIGISMRSTMDIDTTIRNFDLTKEETTRIINEIKDISLDDHIEFILNDVSEIMDNMEYPGIRIHMNSKLENLIVPIKIDISTMSKNLSDGKAVSIKKSFFLFLLILSLISFSISFQTSG